MDQLINFPNGRNAVNEDWIALQNQHLHTYLIYSGYGNIVVTGCRVTPNGSNYNISSGIIYFDNAGTGVLVRFAGAVAVDLSSPKWIILTRTETVQRNYQLLSSEQAGIARYTLSVSGTNIGSSIAIGTSGLAQYFSHIPRGPVGSYLHGDFNDALFDGTGLGTGILLGWALCNGNNGMPNLNNRYLRGTTGTVGVEAGSATHRHKIGQNDITNNTFSLGINDATSGGGLQGASQVSASGSGSTVMQVGLTQVIGAGNEEIGSYEASSIDPHRTTKIIRRIY